MENLVNERESGRGGDDIWGSNIHPSVFNVTSSLILVRTENIYYFQKLTAGALEFLIEKLLPKSSFAAHSLFFFPDEILFLATAISHKLLQIG